MTLATLRNDGACRECLEEPEAGLRPSGLCDECATCGECGTDYNDDGDGYDGMCAGCADRAEEEG